MRHTHLGFALALPVVFAAAWAGRASAAVIPYEQLTQTRQLDAHVTARSPAGVEETDGASEPSSALGSFARSMSFRIDHPFTPPDPARATVEATAAQEVYFGDTAIFGTLTHRSHVQAVSYTATASSGSSWGTTFTVAQETPFSLKGRVTSQSVATLGPGTFSAGFVFNGQGPNNASEDFVHFGVSGTVGEVDQPLDASGVLHPGWVYTISAGVSGMKDVTSPSGDKVGEGRIDFALTVHEPGAGVGLVGLAILLGRRPRGATAASA